MNHLKVVINQRHHITMMAPLYNVISEPIQLLSNRNWS